MFLKTHIFMVLLVSYYGAIGITIRDNRYELNVALSERALTVDPADYDQFLLSVKEVLTEASRLLFEATNFRAYFGTVNILIPRFWTVAASPTTGFSYESADIRVEETKMSDDATVIEYLRTKNPKPCGQPGDHIVVPPHLFTNAGGWSDKYGDRVKTFIHEFARFRYGVFEEYGFKSEKQDDMFPYSFVNVHGHTQVTGCNDSAIIGDLRLKNDRNTYCTLDQETCHFYPDLNSQQGPSTSLMFMHFLKSTTKFCDDSNHDRTAPNRQNHFCRNRSIKTVIENSRDFRGVNQPLPQTTNTMPTFNIQVAASKVVYVVLDTSTYDGKDEMEFNIAKTRVLEDLIPRLSNLEKRVLMGVAKMGATLTELQSPIPVKGNEITLRNIVNGITRGGNELNVEKGLLEVGHKMKSFAHLSGSDVLFFKFNSRTDRLPNFESEAIAFFNTRNVRLLTYESGLDGSSMEYISRASYGHHEPANNQNYLNSINNIISLTVVLANDPAYIVPSIPLVARTVEVTRSNPVKSSVRNDYKSAEVGLRFFVPVSASGYTITVKDVPLSNAPNYKSWDGRHNIYIFAVNASSSSFHSYEITTTSSTPLQVHIFAIEKLHATDAPLHLGGGGQVSSKPVEVEITTSGDNGLLNMGIATSEDTSFLIYAYIRKGDYVAINSLVVALVQGPNGVREVVLEDKGKYPDVLAGDGIYSGFFKPDPINALTTYTISARIKGFTVSNTFTRSLPIDQDNYCCGPTYIGDATSTFYERYIPHAATLGVVGAETYKEKPGRITDFKITGYSKENDLLTLEWTVPSASFGTQDKPDYYKVAYGYNSTIVIDAVTGLIPTKASLVNDVSQPGEPGSTQQMTIKLSQLQGSSSLLYFTISSVKNGTAESYPAPIVYFDTREVAASTVPSQISSIASSIPSTQASTQTPTESLTGSPTESPTESPAETVSPTQGSTQTGTTSTVSILTTTNPNGASRHCGSLGVILITVYISLRMFFQNC